MNLITKWIEKRRQRKIKEREGDLLIAKAMAEGRIKKIVTGYLGIFRFPVYRYLTKRDCDFDKY